MIVGENGSQYEIKSEDIAFARADASKPRLHSYSEVMNLPEPDWHIPGIFRRGEMVVLYGPPACGKTFVALSIAQSIASGSGWYGRAVRHGPVVYIAAEGGFALPPRLRAWATGRDAVLSGLERDFWVLRSPVQFTDLAALNALIGLLRELPDPPELIVVDTLARCMAGRDENSTMDMGLFVNACDELRTETGATVVIVHHSGKETKKERGSSALRGAADTMIQVKKDGDRVTLHCSKQKEAEEFSDLEFLLEQVTVGTRVGESSVTSCRLRPVAPVRDLGESHQRLAERHLTILTELGTPQFEKGVGRCEIVKALGIPRASAYRNLREVIAKGYAQVVPNGKRELVVLTEKGREELVSPVSTGLSQSQRDESHSLTVPPPPKGGGPDETGNGDDSPVAGDTEQEGGAHV